MHDHLFFYKNTITTLRKIGHFNLKDEILVVNGGENDAKVLRDLGFLNVTISNLDERIDGEAPFSTYVWSFQNTENLSFGDDTFDYVLVHSGLHHVRCPQKAISEMLRVAKKGILAFELHDCIYTRLGVRLGFGQEYETAAVFYNDLKHGGLNNTFIPNFVYRFSAREIIKTIQVNDPTGEHNCHFFYTTRMPERLKKMKNPCFRWFFVAFERTLTLLGQLFTPLSNNIAFFVEKHPKSLFPWLKRRDGKIIINESYLSSIYSSDNPSAEQSDSAND